MKFKWKVQWEKVVCWLQQCGWQHLGSRISRFTSDNELKGTAECAEEWQKYLWQKREGDARAKLPFLGNSGQHTSALQHLAERPHAFSCCEFRYKEPFQSANPSPQVLQNWLILRLGPGRALLPKERFNQLEERPSVGEPGPAVPRPRARWSRHCTRSTEKRMIPRGYLVHKRSSLLPKQCWFPQWPPRRSQARADNPRLRGRRLSRVCHNKGAVVSRGDVSRTRCLLLERC